MWSGGWNKCGSLASIFSADEQYDVRKSSREYSAASMRGQARWPRLLASKFFSQHLMKGSQVCALPITLGWACQDCSSTGCSCGRCMQHAGDGLRARAVSRLSLDWHPLQWGALRGLTGTAAMLRSCVITDGWPGMSGRLCARCALVPLRLQRPAGSSRP